MINIDHILYFLLSSLSSLSSLSPHSLLFLLSSNSLLFSPLPSSGNVDSGGLSKHHQKTIEPSQKYYFESHGISRMPSLANKELTWGAGFENNIEQFIYPSLQTLNEPDIELGREDSAASSRSHGGKSIERLANRRRSSVVDPRSLANRATIVNKLTSNKNITFEEEDDPKLLTQKIFQKKLKAAAEAPVDYTLFKEKALNWKVVVNELPELVKEKINGPLHCHII